MHSLFKPIVEIKNWCVDDYRGVLYGDSYGHYNFKDGTSIRTSSIVGVSKESDKFIVETRNTRYLCMFEEYHDLDDTTIDDVYKMLQKCVDMFNW